MAETLTVQITAQDGATKVFKAISNGAQDVGKTVESAGKQGAKGMDELGKSAEDNAERLERVKAEATAIGAVLGVMGAGLIKAGQSARDQRLQIEALNRMYGDAADSILNYTEAMQDMTMVSNDQARQSAQIFATLTQNYGLSIEQVEQLMMRAADLSVLFGKNVTDTSQMIQNALRGEAEYIEQVNITLNDNFVAAEAARRGMTGWTTTMTDAEKAAFRFQLFMEQSEYATGAAADEAERAGGRFRQFINEMQDGTQAVGTFLGPIGEVAAELAPIAMALPVVTAGMGNLVGRLRGSTLAMSALGLATNPVALGVTAVAAGAAVLWASFREGQKVTESLEQGFKSLAETQDELILSGSDAAAERVNEFSSMMTETLSIIEGQRNNLTNMFPNWADLAAEQGVSPTKWLLDLQHQYEFTSEEAERFAVAQSRIGAALADPRVNGEALLETVADLQYQLMAGQITGDEFLAQMEALTLNLGQFREGADDASNAATGLAAAFGLLKEEGSGLLDTILNLNTVTEDDSFADRLLKTLGLDASQRAQVDSTLETIRGLRVELEGMPEPGAEQSEWVAWINEEGISQAERTRRINAANEARREEEQSTRMATIAEAAHTTALDAGNAAMDEHAARTAAALQIGESWNVHLEERNALIEENIARLQEAAGVDDPLSQWNMGQHATDMSMMADATLDAATALDTVFRVVVSNTDAIGKQVQGVEDWALELINVRGEYGKIDDLLAAGTITLQQYNAAQEAQETISAANLAIQEDILTIQAMQAPLVADHTAALADQMGVIAEMPAELQLVALGWMDATTAGRAMEFQMLAASVAAGELGANGEQAFTSMITGAAQADPVLKSLLIDMGLISEGADGTITVNLDGAEQAQSELDLLSVTIADLIDLLDDGVLNASYKLKVEADVEGEDDVESLKASLQSVPAEKWITIGIEEPPSGLFSNLVNNVLGSGGGDGTGGPAVTVPVNLEVPDNVAGLLESELGGQSVEVEIAPVIRTGMDWLSGGIGALLGGPDGPQDTTVTIDAVDNATPVIDGITAQLTALGAWSPTVTIEGDGSHAQNVLDAYRAYDGVAIANPSVDILGDGSNAQNVIDAYMAYDGVTIAEPLVSVVGDASHAQNVIDGYMAFDGVVLATSYIDIVTRTSTVKSNNRHGGIPGYAHGGVIAELAEAGPEVLHFANGGTATVFDRGHYAVPTGTYVSPNNTYTNDHIVNEGTTVNLHVHGNVYGIDDLVDSFASAISQRRAGFGGVS